MTLVRVSVVRLIGNLNGSHCTFDSVRIFDAKMKRTLSLGVLLRGKEVEPNKVGRNLCGNLNNHSLLAWLRKEVQWLSTTVRKLRCLGSLDVYSFFVWLTHQYLPLLQLLLLHDKKKLLDPSQKLINRRVKRANRTLFPHTRSTLHYQLQTTGRRLILSWSWNPLFTSMDRYIHNTHSTNQLPHF